MNIRLKDIHNLRVQTSIDIYEIMLKILLRENKVDLNREHLWTICLDAGSKILNIELVSMGSINRTLAEPMEVFSIPLQKRAASIVLVHNHTSGLVNPSSADKELTDKLIQCGRLLNVPVMDHLIISPDAFYSFGGGGLLDELRKSTRYVPEYELKANIEKQVAETVTQKAQKANALAIAEVMKKAGEPIEKIMAYTGLTKAEVEGIKTQ